MAWNTPAVLTTGTRITDSIWNTFIVDNLLALSTHAHSGAPGDGAALIGLVPIARQKYTNTNAFLPFFSTTYQGGLLGNNGSWAMILSMLMANASVGAKSITASLIIGGTTIVSLASITATGLANSRQLYTSRFEFANTGAQNAQIVKIVNGADNDGTSFVAGGAAATTPRVSPAWGTAAIDTSLPFTLQAGVTMSAADPALSIESVFGYVMGPMYAP